MSVPDWMIDTPSPSVDDMAALIRRLSRSLRKAAPGHALADQALDYLARVGMTGDIMRAPAEAPANEGGDALSLARTFHETYERLAPGFGYTTRPDTREFDPASVNGRLMTAVCAEIIAALAAPAQGDAKVLADADMFWDADDPERMAYSINDVVLARQGDCGVAIGDEFEVQRAKRLPNARIRITAVPDDEGNGDLEWEEIDTLRAARQSKTQGDQHEQQ